MPLISWSSRRNGGVPFSRSILAFSLLILSSSAATPPIEAGEIPLAATAQTEIVDQLAPSAAALEGGGLASVWFAGEFPATLKMQWTNSAGDLLLDPGGRVIAGGDGNGIGAATIVARRGGGAFVGFGKLISSDFKFFVQAFDGSGAPLWPGEGIPVSVTGDSQNDISLTSDMTGGVYACFSLLQDENVKCQHFDRDGANLWHPEGIVTGGMPGVRTSPVTLSDGLGGLLVFWRNLRDPNGAQIDNLLIEGQRFNAPGQILWGGGILVRDTLLPGSFGFSPNLLSAVSDGDGGALLAFEALADASSANNDIVAQRVTLDGQLPWGSNGVTVLADEAVTRQATIAAGSDASLAVISIESVGDNGSRLRAFRLGADGEHLWPEQGLDVSDPASTKLNYFPHASFDGGVLRIAWTKQLAELSLEMDVVLTRFGEDGKRLGPDEIIVDAPNSQFCQALVYAENPPQTFVVWEDLRKGSFDDVDIYAAGLPTGLLFTDGFELGNLSAWDLAVP